MGFFESFDKNKVTDYTYNGKRYLLFYDPSNGNVVLRRHEGSIDYTTVFENGGFNVEGANDPNLSAEGFDNVQNQITADVINAHQTAGGNANGKVLPAWADAKKEQVEKSINQNNQQSGFFAGLADNLNISGFSVTERTIRAMMPLQYPKDAIYENRISGYNQDYVRILQYTYKAPKPSLVRKSEGRDPIDIATKGIQRKSPLEKYLGQVKLPMPNDVTDSNNVAWGQDTMSNFAAAITSIVGGKLGETTAAAAGGLGIGAALGNASAGASIGTWGSILKNAGITKETLEGNANTTAGLRAALQSRLLAQAGVQVSAEAILARGLGVIPNANMELLFQAPALREFQFNWKMTPRDEEEARKIRNIIRFFKQGMAARKVGPNSYAGASSLFLKTPNVFHVQYKTNKGNNSEGLNRIKTCALTGTSVNYTPEGVWASYEEGQPVASIMSLRFQELEPVYDTDYQHSVAAGRIFDETPSGSSNLGDLYRIGQNEVGY